MSRMLACGRTKERVPKRDARGHGKRRVAATPARFGPGRAASKTGPARYGFKRLRTVGALRAAQERA